MTKRTVQIELQTNTTGTDKLEALATEMGKLAKTAGESAPEIERIAGELAGIARQKDVAAAFNQLSTSLDDVRGRLKAAHDATETQRASMEELRAASRQASDALVENATGYRQAQAALSATRLGYREAQAAVSAYVAEIGGAKSASRAEAEVLREKTNVVRQAKAAYDEARATVERLTPAYADLKTQAAGAEDAVRKQERAMRDASAAADTVKAEYTELKNKLEAVDRELVALGVDSSKLTGELARMAVAEREAVNAANNLKTALAETKQAAAGAGTALDNAFNAAGVRSRSQIQAEIQAIRQGLKDLSTNANVGAQDIARASAAAEERIKALNNEMKGATGSAKDMGSEFSSAFKQFGTAALVFNGVTAAIGALANAAQAVPKVTAEFQTLNRTLTIVAGSQSAAAKELEYLRGVAARTGADIIALGKSYAKLAAATKDTTIAGEQTKRVFEAVTGAMGTLGASAAETENALMAVTQIVSKGQLSLEEWRQQLGERLPGAAQATAKELGLTTAELTELITAGKLAADDVFPALSAGLEKLYQTGARNDTLISKWRDFTNALKESGSAIGDSGLLESLLKAGRVGVATAATMAEGFVFAGRSIGAVAAGIKTGDMTGAMSDLSNEAVKLQNRMGTLAGFANKATESLVAQAEAAKAAGKAAFTAADGVEYQTDAVLKSGNGFVKFLNDNMKAQEQAERFATTARKVAEYTRASGEAAITTANAIGTEADQRRVAQQVAEDNAGALAKLAEKETEVLRLMEQEAEQRAIAMRDGVAMSDAHQKALRELGDEMAQRRAALDGLNRQVEANKVNAEALRIAAEVTKDNSGRLTELTAANEEFLRVLPIVRAEVEAGNLTKQQAAVIEQEAARTKRLLIDAQQDEIKNIQATAALRSSTIGLERTGIELQIARQKSLLATAQAMGDEYGMLQATTAIKRLEAKLSEATSKQKMAEADATLALVAAERKRLQTIDQLTPAKLKELEAQELAAKGKKLEAEIARETARQLRELADATNAAGSSARQSADGFDAMGEAARRAAGDVNALANASAGIKKQEIGFGSNVATSVDLTPELYKAGGNIQEAKAAQKYFGELLDREMYAMPKNLGNETNAARQRQYAIRAAAERALEYARKEIQTGQQIDMGTSVSDLAAYRMATNRDPIVTATPNTVLQQASREASAAPIQQKQPVVMNLTIDRKTQPLTVASYGDATNLADMLRRLQTDQARY